MSNNINTSFSKFSFLTLPCYVENYYYSYLLTNRWIRTEKMSTSLSRIQNQKSIAEGRQEARSSASSWNRGRTRENLRSAIHPWCTGDLCHVRDRNILLSPLKARRERRRWSRALPVSWISPGAGWLYITACSRAQANHCCAYTEHRMDLSLFWVVYRQRSLTLL